MTITTTQTAEIFEDKQLWSGLVEFSVEPDCSVDFLAGAVGGYVHAFGRAGTSLGFLDRVSYALKQLMATPSQFSEIEQIVDLGSLSVEWKQLCRQAESSDEIVWGEFFLYDQEEDPVASA